MTIHDKIEEEINQLRTVRDELRVQVNLAGKEIRDQFQDAEKSWGELETHLHALERETRDSMHDVGNAARELLEEIRTAYHRIRAQV